MMPSMAAILILFLSTLSLRRATAPSHSLYLRNKNFYPRSPCGERPPLTSRTKTIAAISIHALLAESDSNESSEHTNNGNFYPRSPCGERRGQRPSWGECQIFLSTLSLRRATA